MTHYFDKTEDEIQRQHDFETAVAIYKGRRENVPRGRADRLVWAVENCTTRRLS